MEGKPISSLSLIFLSLPSLDSSLVNQESKEEKEERERRLTDRFLGSDGNQDSFLFFFSHGGCQKVGPKVAKFLDR